MLSLRSVNVRYFQTIADYEIEESLNAPELTLIKFGQNHPWIDILQIYADGVGHHSLAL